MVAIAPRKHGAARGESDFDSVAGVDTADLFKFVGTTQGEQWGHRVDSSYGGDVIPRAGRLNCSAG